MTNYKKPMFSEFLDLLKIQNRDFGEYRKSVDKLNKNTDYSPNYKERTKQEIDKAYLTQKSSNYETAKELITEQITAFNNENIDTDFLLKCKMLGDVMPDITIKNYLAENMGKFRTAEALNQIYKEDTQKQVLIDPYLLKIDRIGELPKRITVDQYIKDLGTTIENYFTDSQELPTDMGYRGKLSYNQVINILNAGRKSQGDESIDFDTTANFNFSKNEEIKEPTVPSDFNFNFNK